MLDLVKEMGKLGCKLVETLIEQNHRLEEALEDTPIDRGTYKRLVGRLIYLLHTRLDITYVLTMVSHFMHDPKEIHL